MCPSSRRRTIEIEIAAPSRDSMRGPAAEARQGLGFPTEGALAFDQHGVLVEPTRSELV